jgi:hypothetical protein
MRLSDWRALAKRSLTPLPSVFALAKRLTIPGREAAR